MRIAPAALALMLIFPAVASACDFAYSPSSELFRRADAIFVGKVLESPWKRGSNGDTVLTGRGSFSVRFSVEKAFRGTLGKDVKLSSRLTDCSYAFLEGETYLVHAHRRDREWDTGSPQRPLLLADAGEALKYVEGAVRNRPPGLLYGYVVIPLPATANVPVHLEGGSGHFLTRIDPHQYFEIVAPPGRYSVWLELNGNTLGERKNVRLTEGKAVLHSF